MKLSNFQIINAFGEGGYGSVFVAKSKKSQPGIVENELVAIKIIHKKNTLSICKELKVSLFIMNKIIFIILFQVSF